MKARDLRELTEVELRDREKELRQELFNLRFQKATGQLSNSAMIPRTKRDLARVKTVLREREISSISE